MELLLPLLFILPLLWLFSRQRKQQQSQVQMQHQLQPGVEIMTTAGMFGRVVAVEDGVMTLEVSPGVEVRLITAAVAKLVTEPVAPVVDYDDEVDHVDDEDENSDVVDLTKNDHDRREA